MKRIIIIPLIFLFNSCNRDIPTPPVITNTGSQLKITDISPTTGRPGSVLIITGSGFDTTAYKNTIKFKGDVSFADSGSAEKLFTTVPFYAETGAIKVLAKNDSADGPVFNVIPINKNGLNIVQYTGPPLTQPQSFLIDCKSDSIKWTGVRNGDTLTLSITGCYGDESASKLVLKFYNNLNDVRPNFVLGQHMYSEYSPYNFRTDTLKGFVAIQDWNISNVVSGKVTAYDSTYHDWWSFVFWYKFN